MTSSSAAVSLPGLSRMLSGNGDLADIVQLAGEADELAAFAESPTCRASSPQ